MQASGRRVLWDSSPCTCGAAAGASLSLDPSSPGVLPPRARRYAGFCVCVLTRERGDAQVSAPPARPPSFRDAGFEQPETQIKPFFPSHFQKARGPKAPGADTALHSPSGEWCCLGSLAPATAVKVRQTAPSMGHPLNQTCWLRGRNHRPGTKRLKPRRSYPSRLWLENKSTFSLDSGRNRE